MGKTLAKTLMEIKERIRHAMNGELPQGEDENGTIYKSASREECDKYILAAYDQAVYHCLEANKFGKVYDKILEKNGIKPTMKEIVLLKADEDAKKTEYEFEPFVDFTKPTEGDQ